MHYREIVSKSEMIKFMVRKDPDRSFLMSIGTAPSGEVLKLKIDRILHKNVGYLVTVILDFIPYQDAITVEYIAEDRNAIIDLIEKEIYGSILSDTIFARDITDIKDVKEQIEQSSMLNLPISGAGDEHQEGG